MLSLRLRSRGLAPLVWVGLVGLFAPAFCAAPCAAQEEFSSEELDAELCAAFRRQGAFQARLRYESEALSVKGVLEIAYQPKEARYFLRTVQSAPPRPIVYARFEAGRMAHWGGQDRAPSIMTYDLEALLGTLYPITCATAELRGEEAPSAEAFRAGLETEINLLVSRNEAGRPNLDIGLGVSSHPAMWLRGLRPGEGRNLSVDAAEVRLELPLQGLAMVIDRKTGFFKSQRVELQGGGSFSLKTESFGPLESFPAARPPAGTQVESLDLQLFEEISGSLSAGVLARLAALPVEGEGGQRLVRACQAFSAAHSHVRRQHLIRGFALKAVNHNLEQLSLAQLQSDLPNFVKACQERAAQGFWSELERTEQALIERFGSRVLQALPEDAPLREAARAALEPAAVRAKRAPDLALEAHLGAVLKERAAAAEQK